MAASGAEPAPPARRSWRKRLLALLLGFGLLELGLRVWLTRLASERDYTRYMPLSEVPRDEWLYRGHHYLNYCLSEGYESRDGANRHNALGYRGPEAERRKPAGTYRILVLGGSSTYETGIADWRESTWVEMQRVLREELGHPEAEVINAGCGGWTSWESLLDLSLRGLWLEPDLVVVYCGTNDVHARLVPPELYARDNSAYRIQWDPSDGFWEHSVVLRMVGIWVGLARKNSLGGLSSRDYEGADERLDWLAANAPDFFADNLRQMAALCRGQGVAVLLASWAWSREKGDYAASPVYQRGFEEINAATRAVAEELGLPFYDHAARMPGDGALWADGRHVNAAGGRVKARLFAEHVAERFLASAGR